jgi:hypothetical protein
LIDSLDEPGVRPAGNTRLCAGAEGATGKTQSIDGEDRGAPDEDALGDVGRGVGRRSNVVSRVVLCWTNSMDSIDTPSIASPAIGSRSAPVRGRVPGLIESVRPFAGTRITW